MDSVTVNTNDADIQISWTDLDSDIDGGSPVLGYYVQINSGFNTDFIEPGTQIVLPATLTNIFTGLTKGATYKFRVAAYNEIYTTNALGSELNFSPELSVVAAIAPDQVTTFYQKSSYVNGQITLVWEAPETNGSPITNYKLYKDNGLGVYYKIYSGLKTEYTDSGLSSGGSYTYMIRAVNKAGSSIDSDPLVGIAGALPSPPTDLTIDLQSSTTLTFSWSVPDDSGGLVVQNYTVNEDAADLVYGSDIVLTVLTHSMTVDPADIGKTFSFKVAAQNILGKGDYADDIQLIAADPPAAPTMSLIKRGPNSLYLKFIPDADAGGSVIEGYELYIDQGITGSPFTLIADVASEQILYNATDLITGNEYTFKLYSKNPAHLSSSYSDSYIVGVVPEKANEPSLYASDRGTVGGTDGSITIEWVATDDTSGLPITSYLLYIDDGAGTFGTAIEHTDLTNLVYQFTGLADGEDYGIMIEAVNAIGAGESSTIVYLAAASVPDAPSTLVFETATRTSISFAWSPPSDDGGSSITGYKAYMNDFTDDKDVLVYDGSSRPSVLSFNMTGLTADNFYRFKVTALNRVGESLTSDYSTFYCADLPGSPGAPTLVSSNTSAVTFEWTPPVDSGGADINYYEIFYKRSTASESAWVSIGTTDINTLEFEHSSITTGTGDVQYKIRAVSDDRGAGAFSMRSTFILASSPVISTAPVVVSKTVSTITVSWELTDDGGSSILGYKLYRYNIANGKVVLAYDGSSNSVVTSATDTGLSAGITYGYRVVAINRVGTSDLSPEVTAVPAEVPGKPPAPEYVSSYADNITLSFEPTSVTNGLNIIRYHLYRDQGNLTAPFTEISSYTGDEMEFTVTTSNEAGMVTGNEYRFYFTAENALGEGPASDIVTFGLGSLPDQPSAPTVKTEYSTLTSLYIEWDPLTSQDLVVEGYRLYGDVKYSNSSKYLSDLSTSSAYLIYDGHRQPSTYAYNVSGLVTGSSYSFYVVANNINGESDSSDILSGFVCLAPSGLSAPTFVEATTSYITVEWTAPDSDGGCPITGYELFINDGLGGDITTQVNQTEIQNKPYITEWKVESLTEIGNEYLFKVVVYNENGYAESDSVAFVLAAVPDTPGSAPVQDYNSAGRNQIAMTYGMTTSENGGSPILGYQIWRDNGEGGDFFYVFHQDSVLAESYIDYGLENGKEYRYKYRARNINGWSEFSDVAYLIAADVPSKPPTPVLLSVNDTYIAIDLTAPSDNGGSVVIDYTIYIDSGGINRYVSI